MAHELSVTFPVGNRWANAPSVLNGRQLGEDEVRELVMSGQLRPHGVFPTQQAAEMAAMERSDAGGGSAVAPSLRFQSEATQPPTGPPEPSPTFPEMEGDGGFDVNAARRAGYEFDEIADYLARDSDFDVQGAREAGYEDAEIVSYITRGKGFVKSGSAAQAGVQGAYGGLADLAGTLIGGPIDASNALLRKAGVPIEPVDAMSAPRRALSDVELPGGTPLTYESLEDLPPERRPFAVGGEVVGGSLIPAAAPLAAARAGVQGGKMLKPVLDMARSRPGTFAAVEAGSVAGSAQMGGMAEALRPGDEATRFGAEVVGAFANPTGLAVRGLGKGASSAKRAAQGFTRTGREAAAGDILQGAMREMGEEPADVARALSTPDIVPGIERLTAGQKTGSPTLLAIEMKLAGRSPHFAGEAAKRADEGIGGLRSAIDDLVRSGDPESLQKAAQLRERYFNELLDRRIARAKQGAEAKTAGLPQRGRAQAQDASVDAEQTLSAALKDARGVEHQLWSAIDKKVPIRPQNVQLAHAGVRRELLKEEKLDVVTEAFLKRVAPLKRKKGQKVSTPDSGEMLRFRSHLMARAGDARGNGDHDIARLYDRLQRAVLRDLDQVPGTATSTARQYTRALHDAFTRTFAGDALAVKSTGAQRIPPEVLLERGFGAGGNVADVRFREMADASGFGPRFREVAESVGLSPEDLSPRMASAQERFIRVMAAQTRDNAGRVNPNKLQSFLADNANMLERFPGLKGELTDAASAERLFRETEAATERASRAIRNKAAFARLTQSEDPARVVGDAIGNKRTPQRDYEALAKVARRGGKNATEGLKSATLEHAVRQATGPDGTFSFAKFSQALDGGNGKHGVLGLMERSFVMPPAEADRLRRIVQEAGRIEEALANRSRVDELVDAPDALFDLVLRIAGARMGTMATVNGAQGHGLIAAHAGSKFMRRIFDKVPKTRIMDVIEEASRDRELMTRLLTKPTTAKQAKELERQINAALIQAGLTADAGEDEGDGR